VSTPNVDDPSQVARVDGGAEQAHYLGTRVFKRLRQAWPTRLASVRRHVIDHLDGPDLPTLTAALQRFAVEPQPGMAQQDPDAIPDPVVTPHLATSVARLPC
jgi:hypothetical protein